RQPGRPRGRHSVIRRVAFGAVVGDLGHGQMLGMIELDDRWVAPFAILCPFSPKTRMRPFRKARHIRTRPFGQRAAPLYMSLQVCVALQAMRIAGRRQGLVTTMLYVAAPAVRREGVASLVVQSNERRLVVMMDRAIVAFEAPAVRHTPEEPAHAVGVMT